MANWNHKLASSSSLLSMLCCSDKIGFGTISWPQHAIEDHKPVQEFAALWLRSCWQSVLSAACDHALLDLVVTLGSEKGSDQLQSYEAE